MDKFNNLFIVIQLISILVLCINNPISESASFNITTDKQSLITFKSQLSGDQLPIWDENNSSPCNWTGVSCNERGLRVIGLNLSGLRIVGSISPHLGNLSFLSSLELQNNLLMGTIPDQIGNLFRLRNLNLSFNTIRGVIPSNISQCRQLRLLDLKQNQISGHIPEELSNLRQLEVLNLAGNRISGEIPKSLANISSLVNLNLGTNMISGTIPSDLSSLSNIRFLDLTINNLSGIVPPSIYNMSSLVYLALASNNLSGELPGDIAFTLPNLLGFNFCINRFTGTIPMSLHNLTNLQHIRLARNHLHGTIPPGLGNLPNLEMYNIGFNSIVSSNLDFLELLANSTRLNFLAVDFNLLEGEIPNSVGNLSKVLAKLYMGGNNIYGPIPSSISELKGLELLNMSYSSISGEIPTEIGQLKELRILGLADNILSGKIPDSLGNLELLTEIDLSKNELIGSIPITFGNLKNLISVDLSHNKLNGSIPREVFNLPRLNAFLNLSENQLSGPIPQEIGLLQNTMIINISDNMISGDIPSSIVGCRSLEQLLLARNMLSGRIPDSLDSVRGLAILDLSSNRLSGEIPSDLGNMPSLQFLNLSFNNLEGRVPSGGIFENSSKYHLENNQNLCFNSACERSRVRGRRLRFAYIIVSVSLAVSLCFLMGLVCYLRKGKGRVKDSFESFPGLGHQTVSYDEIRLATNNFNEEIGKGSFGVVYKGVLHGAEVAVKVLGSSMARSRRSFLAECAALRHVRHRNLVKLITVCSSIDSKNDEFLGLIFEYMSNGSLEDWLRGKKSNEDETKLSLSQRLSLAIGIACALDYLHNETETPIVHCDLKPSNVLLDSDMTPKVADFGLAKTLLNSDSSQFSISASHTLRGSIGYIPPEYGYGEKPSIAGDVYSFGILLLELLTGKSPTHEMFTGGLSLRDWIEKQFPTNIERVLDSDLLHDFLDEEQSTKLKSPGNALVTIFDIGLSCTCDSPDARISIRDVLRKLKSVESMLGYLHNCHEGFSS